MAARLAKLTAAFWNRGVALDSTVREYSNRKWHKTNHSRKPSMCWRASTNRSASKKWFLQL